MTTEEREAARVIALTWNLHDGVTDAIAAALAQAQRAGAEEMRERCARAAEAIHPHWMMTAQQIKAHVVAALRALPSERPATGEEDAT